MSKVVWIDVENSPHVPFFAPWVPWLEEQGCRVVFTARDLSQTVQLLQLHGLEYTLIGGHGGGGRWRKASRSLWRALSLVRWARKERVELALGHGSRAQALASRLVRIPSLTFLDYEFVSLGLFGRSCQRIFFPESVPADVLRARGIPPDRLVSYPGIKEQLYLDDRGRDSGDSLRPAGPRRPQIVIRPPARMAHYHAALSDQLYDLTLRRLADEATGCEVLIVPRYASELPELRARAERHRHLRVQETPIPSLELLRGASLVISGGGTMVREACVLGIPAASFFGGPLGGVDRYLSDLGRLQLLRTTDDVARLRLPPFTQRADGHGTNASSPRPLPDSDHVRQFVRARVLEWL